MGHLVRVANKDCETTMTRDDLRILCTALGFTAIVLKGEPAENQASRAHAFARLIESFCFVTVPEALGVPNGHLGDERDPAAIDRVIDRYKAELLDQDCAALPTERGDLLKMYDRLLLRQIRREQREFYALGSADMLANRVLQLVEEEIAHEGEDA